MAQRLLRFVREYRRLHPTRRFAAGAEGVLMDPEAGRVIADGIAIDITPAADKAKPRAKAKPQKPAKAKRKQKPK